MWYHDAVVQKCGDQSHPMFGEHRWKGRLGRKCQGKREQRFWGSHFLECKWRAETSCSRGVSLGAGRGLQHQQGQREALEFKKAKPRILPDFLLAGVFSSLQACVLGNRTDAIVSSWPPLELVSGLMWGQKLVNRCCTLCNKCTHEKFIIIVIICKLTVFGKSIYTIRTLWELIF